MNTDSGLVFKFNVANDNPIIAEARKKERIKFGWLCMLASIPFIAFMILSSMSKSSQIWIPLIFGVFILLCVVCSIYFFTTRNGTTKDFNKSKEYIFEEERLVVIEHDNLKNTMKDLTRCLYVKNFNKQFVSNLIEYSDRFEIKVYTGTVNGVPQYKKYILPKDVVGSANYETFKNFLTQKIGSNYLTK